MSDTFIVRSGHPRSVLEGSPCVRRECVQILVSPSCDLLATPVLISQMGKPCFKIIWQDCILIYSLGAKRCKIHTINQLINIQCNWNFYFSSWYTRILSQYLFYNLYLIIPNLVEFIRLTGRKLFSLFLLLFTIDNQNINIYISYRYYL